MTGTVLGIVSDLRIGGGVQPAMRGSSVVVGVVRTKRDAFLGLDDVSQGINVVVPITARYILSWAAKNMADLGSSMYGP